jgi:predicted nucleic acid-binding protein
MVKDDLHVYLDLLPAPVSEGFVAAFEKILGSKQVTDAYLLSLARKHHASLLTFDARLGGLAGSDVETEILS